MLEGDYESKCILGLGFYLYRVRQFIILQDTLFDFIPLQRSFKQKRILDAIRKYLSGFSFIESTFDDVAVECCVRNQGGNESHQ